MGDRVMQNTYRYYPGKFNQYDNRWMWSNQVPLDELKKYHTSRNVDCTSIYPKITHVIKAGDLGPCLNGCQNCWKGWKEPKLVTDAEVLRILGIPGSRRRLPIHERNPLIA